MASIYILRIMRACVVSCME